MSIIFLLRKSSCSSSSWTLPSSASLNISVNWSWPPICSWIHKHHHAKSALPYWEFPQTDHTARLILRDHDHNLLIFIYLLTCSPSWLHLSIVALVSIHVLSHSQYLVLVARTNWRTSCLAGVLTGEHVFLAIIGKVGAVTKSASFCWSLNNGELFLIPNSSSLLSP